MLGGGRSASGASDATHAGGAGGAGVFDSNDDDDDGGGGGGGGATFAEASMDVIRLPDVPEDTLRVALHYLYTGRLSFGAATNCAEDDQKETGGADDEDNDDGDDQHQQQEAAAEAATSSPALGADGYESAQHVMHVASLWALDHLKELVEDAVLRELLQPQKPGEEEEEPGRNEQEAPARPRPAATGGVPAALALPLLSLAEAHQAPKLRLFAMHAVVRNWAAVGASDDFRALPPPLRKEAEWYARSLLL